MGPFSAMAVSQGLQTAGDLTSSFVNYGMSKKLMQKQYDLNMRAWNAQNEYNLPVNQMQRLQDAGLNPHLVYGSGGASATASTPSSVSQGHFNSDFQANTLADLASYQAVLNQRANEHYTNVQATQAELTGKKQRELMDAQIRNLGSTTSVNNENAFTQGIVNSVVRSVVDDPDSLSSNISAAFDTAANWFGDLLYKASGYREKLQSQTSKFSPGAIRAAKNLGRR